MTSWAMIVSGNPPASVPMRRRLRGFVISTQAQRGTSRQPSLRMSAEMSRGSPDFAGRLSCLVCFPGCETAFRRIGQYAAIFPLASFRYVYTDTTIHRDARRRRVVVVRIGKGPAALAAVTPVPTGAQALVQGPTGTDRSGPSGG